MQGMLGTLLESTWYIKQYRAVETASGAAGIIFAGYLCVKMPYQKLSSHVIINIVWHHHLQQQIPCMGKKQVTHVQCHVHNSLPSLSLE